MAINISSLWNGQTNIGYQNTGGNQSADAAKWNASSNANGLSLANPTASVQIRGNGALLQGYMPGSSLSGQVVSKDGNTVTIQLTDSTTIEASLKGNVPLTEGSQVTFLVNSNTPGQIVLSPLFTNLGASPTVENALNSAGLQVNERNVSMVMSMMEQGMGVNKDALLGMHKLVMANPTIDSGVIVRLNQMGLSVNELNANSLMSYENMNHQISDSITNLTQSLSETFSQFDTANLSQATDLFHEIVSFVNEQSILDMGAFQEFLGNESAFNQAIYDALTKELVANSAEGEGVMLNTMPSGMQDTSGLAEANLQNPSFSDVDILAQGKEILKDFISQGVANCDTPIRELLSEGELNQLSMEVLKDGGSNSLASVIANGNLSTKETFQLLDAYLQQNSTDANGTFKMLSDPGLQKLLQSDLENRWLLKPEEFASKERAEGFYKDLLSETAKLADATNQVIGKESAFSQHVTNLHQNVDFLNQLNETFQYIQIPLKMADQNANGDLYVYSKKKNLSVADGSVSAFLHLDMDHLGSVDCYVTMEQQKVSTNFKVADDETLDLIEANIHLLNERLEKRGYQLNATVGMKDEETSVMQEIQKELGVGAVPISTLSFDARA